ncbi:Holliday junction resolvase RuvX [Corynebacterium lizhenjunii]|uniref:Putative pre-16S rRNA nuclease n=1 Tax=Corynebacterium lizhenjunii TaxID=2709394 RepID=A0A7T0KDQ9_9CORY|nr:Holliday junction resolvase RuvX [Corynebacterium lizhenjunii]QPK78219.1 Holliday junction resolvase RuvX [Corynebacterium lizhenjunii]
MAAVHPDTPGAQDPGPGRRLGLDVGTVRIGAAISDRDARLATALETIPRKTGFKDRDQEDIDRILEIIEEYAVVEVVVGLPRDLQGNGSKSVKHAKEIAFRIRRRVTQGGSIKDQLPVVRLGDERLTTVVATTALAVAGVSSRKGRAVVDQAAAVEILQSWLDGRNHALQAGGGLGPEPEPENQGS